MVTVNYISLSGSKRPSHYNCTSLFKSETGVLCDIEKTETVMQGALHSMHGRHTERRPPEFPRTGPFREKYS